MFNSNGDTLASASRDNTIKLWDFQVENLITRGCEWLGSYFVNQSPELLVELDSCQAHNPAWTQEAVDKLIGNADNLARSKNINGAINWYEQALEWDNHLEFNPKDRAAKIMAFEEGIQLIKTGDIETAINHFKVVQSLNPPLKQTIDATVDEIYSSWNELCWIGSLQGYATEVMFACEKSVDLASYHGGFIDSRGLARALTGDAQGAIADFKVFVEWTSDEKIKVQRQAWIDALEKGDNPFTSEVIEALRDD
nr:WD40 domain-containing protein [Adonisia turfae]